MWVHHTGHDESWSYGTKTREWQLDTVAVLERGKASTAPDIAFELKFTKARQRTPENRADFDAVKITLDGDRWSVEPMEKAKGKPDRMPSPLARKFHAALVDATASPCGKLRQQARGRVCVTKAEWEAESTRLGLIDTGAEDNQRRALVSKYRRELIAAEWVACNGDFM
jgi:hypothetical protein